MARTNTNSGGGGGIISINGDTTSAQIIAQGGGISVSTVSGVTTISSTFDANGNFLIGQTSGIISSPTPSSGTTETWLGQGAGVGASTTGTVAIGYNAGNNTGAYTVSIGGLDTGIDNGNYTIAIGTYAGRFNTGTQSTFLNYAAGSTSTGSNSNCFFAGYFAGAGAGSASDAIFIGENSGALAINATGSIFLGSSSGNNATNAVNSIFIGNSAGNNDTVSNLGTNDSSILIGLNTSTGGFKNSIAIGAFATNTAENQLMVGRELGPGITSVVIPYLAGSGPIPNTVTVDSFGNLGSTGVPVNPTALVLFVNGTLDMNTTSDQPFTINAGTGMTFGVVDVVLADASISLTTVDDLQIWTAPGRTGTKLWEMGNSTTTIEPGMNLLVDPAKFIVQSLLSFPTGQQFTATTIYISIGTPQGSAATTNIFINGYIFN